MNQPGELDTSPRPDFVRATTGVLGLDDILNGGFPRHRLYLIEGHPGSGKTTLALQFLREGSRLGERCLYVTLAETAEELRDVAASHGWSLDGIHLLEVDSLYNRLHQAVEYTVYHPSDVELGETTERVRAEVERLAPTRVVLDSVSELKVLAQTSARYRREILALKQFFVSHHCTALILDDRTVSDVGQQLQSIAHGVLRLERESRTYGETRRQLQVVKMRGAQFLDGFHDFRISTGGIEAYPRLEPVENAVGRDAESLISGISALDHLLGGGLDRGSSVLVMGPSGCGKSTLCSQYVSTPLARGEHASFFLFEESRATFLERSAGLGMHLGKYIDSGLLHIEQIDPAQLSPGEFANHLRLAVERRNVRIVVIDSLNGYMNALPNEHFVLIQIRELVSYLGQKGVVTMLVLAQHGMLGGMRSPVDVSFLADTVILLRFFESAGQIRRAISVVKRRRGQHESSIREMQIGRGGIHVGEPLHAFEGVLTGTPRYQGNQAPLLKAPKED